MTVAVDDMAAPYSPPHIRVPPGAKRPVWTMFHMIADTDDELHAMARRIGVLRRWFQGDHYDITKAKRILAVKLGAVEITWREAGRLMHIRRTGGFEAIPVPAPVVAPPAPQGVLL